VQAMRRRRGSAESVASGVDGRRGGKAGGRAVRRQLIKVHAFEVPPRPSETIRAICPDWWFKYERGERCELLPEVWATIDDEHKLCLRLELKGGKPNELVVDGHLHRSVQGRWVKAQANSVRSRLRIEESLSADTKTSPGVVTSAGPSGSGAEEGTPEEEKEEEVAWQRWERQYVLFLFQNAAMTTVQGCWRLELHSPLHMHIDQLRLDEKKEVLLRAAPPEGGWGASRLAIIRSSDPAQVWSEEPEVDIAGQEAVMILLQVKVSAAAGPVYVHMLEDGSGELVVAWVLTFGFVRGTGNMTAVGFRLLFEELRLSNQIITR
jgi:hypothetical protein